ncbi:MAG: serine hydrolase [Acidobacteria bacterium]|nr:serine hydrolase [Acidobacteriota bacterium]
MSQQDGLKVVEHGGGIEGFNTFLTYVPERRIAVVVLSNVNGSAPEAMSSQLLDVVRGKPVILPTERKPVPIAAKDLTKFVGVYDVEPNFALIIAVKGDSLTVQGPGDPATPLMYQGIKDGHARFFVPEANAEIEFIPDAAGTVTSLVLHQSGDHPAKKR